MSREVLSVLVRVELDKDSPSVRNGRGLPLCHLELCHFATVYKGIGKVSNWRSQRLCRSSVINNIIAG